MKRTVTDKITCQSEERIRCSEGNIWNERMEGINIKGQKAGRLGGHLAFLPLTVYSLLLDLFKSNAQYIKQLYTFKWEVKNVARTWNNSEKQAYQGKKRY